jgi:type I restriction-modification system DNA methylase subunit
MPDHTASLSALVQGFARLIKQLKAPETKEATIRQNYIDHFWRELGWDVGDTQQLGPSEAEVIIEKNVETAESTGLRNRRPDYLFRLEGFARFIVEAKKPAVNIETDKEAIFQAKQYAWNSTIPFAILTNFEQFRLYDTTLKPILHEPQRGLVREFSLHYEAYEPQWDVLCGTFGREAVKGGSLERLLAKVKKVKSGRRIRTVDRMLIDLRGGEPVDQVFLAYLDAHRRHLAAEVYQHNKATFPEADTLHGAAKLTEAVQRVMDRLVFMRACEDRAVIPYGSLRETLQRVRSEGGDFYDSLVARWREMDDDYNGYLFKPHFSEELKVAGNVLADFTRTLYPPDGPWDFAAIGDDILGIVYERFLGNVVTVKQGRATIEEKPEVRHAGGVHYTPRFVVDTIIRRVIGPKIQGKSPVQVLDAKILDPACGSGSFLVAALQYLFDYCLDAIHAKPSLATAVVPALSAGSGAKGRKKRAEIAFKDKEGRWCLSPDFRAALLTSCIHGVDIDHQAVEVTVMSLYLKLLEARLPENWATLWVEKQLLPSLDNNIRCGNSLIDEESYFAFREIRDRNHPSLFDEESVDTSFRINRFDWTSQTRGFGRFLDSESAKARGRVGFDCIIGNPPYIRVQELNKWEPEECEFYKRKYTSAAKGSYDIYMVFTEKALSLLDPDGLLGFIMPHKFWQNRDGDGLRKLIADSKHLRAVVDFGDQQVFKGATTYTAIHILAAKNASRKVDVARVTVLEDGITQCAAIDSGRRVPGVQRFSVPSPVGAEVWRFHDSETTAFLDKLKAVGQPLFPAVCEAVFQGIVTGADPVFLSVDRKPHPTNTALLLFKSDVEEAFVEIERAITVPVVRRQGFESFVADARQVLILPYDRDTEHLLPAKEIARSFPLAWKYLKRHQEELAAREKGRFADCWWCLSRAQNIKKWLGNKVLVPYMIERLQAVADDEGRFFVNVTTGGYGLILQPKVAVSIGDSAHKYISGLLNSTLMDYAMRRLSNHFHGGYYPANKQYLQHLPIKVPATAEDRRLADRITDSVRVIMDAKVALRVPKLSDREKTQLEASIEAHEKRINEAVFALYGVEGLPGD